MTRNEINILRANIIGGMDAYIRDAIGDDEVTEYWLAVGMPDGSTEDDLLADVDDEDTFIGWCHVFSNCVKMARVN